MVSPPALVRVAVEGEAEKIGGAVHLQWLSWQPDLYPKRVAWNARVETNTHTHTHTHTHTALQNSIPERALSASPLLLSTALGEAETRD